MCSVHCCTKTRCGILYAYRHVCVCAVPFVSHLCDCTNKQNWVIIETTIGSSEVIKFAFGDDAHYYLNRNSNQERTFVCDKLIGCILCDHSGGHTNIVGHQIQVWSNDTTENLIPVYVGTSKLIYILIFCVEYKTKKTYYYYMLLPIRPIFIKFIDVTFTLGFGA